MKLLIIKGAKGEEELVTENADANLIETTVKSLDWREFNFVTLNRDDNNWFCISGNLNKDGLAIILEENGEIHISDKPPESLSDIIEGLNFYLKGEINASNLNPQIDNFSYQKLKEFELWKITYEAKRKEQRRNHIIAVFAAILIISFVSYIIYLVYWDEYKFLGHETEIGIARVVHTEWHPSRGGYVQLTNYQFEFEGQQYKGFFKGGSLNGRHKVGDKVKIKFALDDPTISKRIATLKRKKYFTQ